VNSGQTQGRVRLNRGGDRDANSALWRIAIVRLATDPETRDYVAERQSEGKTKSEAIRCLKRYIAREIYNALPTTAIV
jgi:transposase